MLGGEEGTGSGRGGRGRYTTGLSVTRQLIICGAAARQVRCVVRQLIRVESVARQLIRLRSVARQLIRFTY